MASRAQHGKHFPWWIVWIWSGILAGLFYWLWNQRGRSPVIQPVRVDLSFLRHPSAPLPEASPRAEVLLASPAAPEKTPEPVQAAAVQPDDLTLIRGIGPKIARILREAGIDTFKRLAQTGPEALREILQAANLRLADPESWPAQAQLAAQAGLEEPKGASPRKRAGRGS